jgi:peroxiredoxin
MFGRRTKVLVAVGAKAPAFRLVGLDGSARTLDDILSAGPALLAFFKISCPVCQLTAPYLQRLSANKTIQVIGISQDDADATRGFLERFGVTVPTLLDLSSEGYPASNAYGVTSVPSLFLLERDGTIARALNGFSRRDFEEMGAGAGVPFFGPEEHVPEWKAG